MLGRERVACNSAGALQMLSTRRAVLESPEIIVRLESGIVLGDRIGGEHRAEGVVGPQWPRSSPLWWDRSVGGASVRTRAHGSHSFDRATRLGTRRRAAERTDPAETLLGERSKAKRAVVDNERLEKGQRKQASAIHNPSYSPCRQTSQEARAPRLKDVVSEWMEFRMRKCHGQRPAHS